MLKNAEKRLKMPSNIKCKYRLKNDETQYSIAFHAYFSVTPQGLTDSLIINWL